MPAPSPSSRSLGLAALVLLAVSLLVTANVSGSRAAQPSSDHRVATVDLLTLLEDMLQTEDYKPPRDVFRAEWENRITALQNRIQQIETELRLSAPTDPNVGALQQQYQQAGFEYQQLSREAAIAFDQFNAEQAAEAYESLHENATALAEGLGYTHLFVSRSSGEITERERGNLATVTQEILARPILMTPEGDDLTARLRDSMSIPVPPDPEDVDEAGDAAEGGDPDSE